MNPEAFISSIKTVFTIPAFAAQSRHCSVRMVADLSSGSVELSRWFSSLSDSDRERVEQVVQKNQRDGDGIVVDNPGR